MLDKRKSMIMSIAINKSKHKDSVGVPDNSRIAAIILSIGLLVHNIFEGMAIGLSSSPNALLIIMIAVCSHKLITAFSLGLSFYQAEWFDCSAITVMIMFTIAGPIGTIAGFIMAADAPAILEGIFMSLTSGTFL